MRVLHLGFKAVSGGAAFSTYRVHRALLAAGVESRYWVKVKDVEDETVIALPTRPTTPLEQLPTRIGQKLDRMQIPEGAEFTTDRATMAPSQLDGIEEFDVVHLHYLNHGFDEGELFHRLGKAQRLFWTLHDANPFTGGCHILNECERYTIGCGVCPRLGATTLRDLSFRIAQRKRARLEGFDMTFIGQSRWIVESSQRSIIGRGLKHLVIPEAVDTARYLPTDREAAKGALGLPLDKITVGWMAVSVEEKRKGLDLLQAAMQQLPGNRYHVVWAGKGEFDLQIPGGHTRLAARKGLDEILQFYAACDIMAVPSREESFCLVAAEAASCGTPVVAFRATGLMDALSDGVNGFLVEPFSAEAMGAEISRIAELSPTEYEALRVRIRAGSVDKYDIGLLAQRHIEAYSGQLA